MSDGAVLKSHPSIVSIFISSSIILNTKAQVVSCFVSFLLVPEDQSGKKDSQPSGWSYISRIWHLKWTVCFCLVSGSEHGPLHAFYMKDCEFKAFTLFQWSEVHFIRLLLCLQEKTTENNSFCSTHTRF